MYTANFSPIKSAGKPRVARGTLQSACNYHGDYMLPEIPAKTIRKFEKKILIKSIY